MRAGRLRHRITLQSVTLSKDTTGEEVEQSAATLRTVYGEARKMAGAEAYHAQQTIQDAEWKFRFRAADVDDLVSGVSGTTTYRVSYGGKTYNILSIDPTDGRGREIEMLCSERR